MRAEIRDSRRARDATRVVGGRHAANVAAQRREEKRREMEVSKFQIRNPVEHTPAHCQTGMNRTFDFGR